MERRPVKVIGTLGVVITTMFVMGGAPHVAAVNAATGRFAGLMNCYGCHADDNPYTGCSPVFGDSELLRLNGQGWLNGPHGNYESRDEHHQDVDLGSENIGFPNYGYAGLGTSPDCTTECHDPLADGTLFENFALMTGLEYLGRVNRPVIGCESCHGPGGRHRGWGPIAVAQPGAEVCGKCHDESFPDGHLRHHPEGAEILEDYLASPHADSMNSHVYSGETLDVRARCARCHTNEGARLYIGLADGTAGYDELGEVFAGIPDLSGATGVQCSTCHDAHNPHLLLGAKASGLPETWSDEFKTCTSCHQLLKADGTLLTEGYHDPAVNSHGSLEEVITDTHFDDPETQAIEGYVVDPASDHTGTGGNSISGTCRDCHNPHDADITVHLQWAHSAHGGHIAEVKEADPQAGVGEEEGAAWYHYDFKGDSRASCAYCHTATGFRNFANDPAGYDPAENVFVATGEQRELLYCWACHTSNVGGLRDPGPFAGTADFSQPADRIAGVADLAGSNICLVCHAGRQSGTMLKELDFAAEIAGSTFGSFNPHYLSAGGTIFRLTGYEYHGRDYADSYFKHGLIGTDDAPGTGENGPCVACHMQTEEGHSFLAVTDDHGSGEITAITAWTQICSGCHADAMAVTPESLNELRAGFEASLDALKDQLAARGIYMGSSYPYFFSTADPAGQNMANAFKAWPDHDTIGAAFNLSLLSHEPGAYVHNQLYARRLIYDAIDYLDDGVLNSSVPATLGAGPAYDYLKDTRS